MKNLFQLIEKQKYVENVHNRFQINFDLAIDYSIQVRIT